MQMPVGQFENIRTNHANHQILTIHSNSHSPRNVSSPFMPRFLSLLSGRSFVHTALPTTSQLTHSAFFCYTINISDVFRYINNAHILTSYLFNVTASYKQFIHYINYHIESIIFKNEQTILNSSNQQLTQQ